MNHPVTWASPRPMWRGAAVPGRAPSILRFASDDFMQQLLGLLATDPAALGAHVARPETWRTPAKALATPDLAERMPLPAPVRQARLSRLLRRTADPAPITPEPDRPLKLYQPAHQRFYLATATLACAIPGLPDRMPGGGHERTGMVLRRLLPRTKSASGTQDLAEFAYVKAPEGARWQLVADGAPDVLAPGEDLQPVFPLLHRDGAQVRRRIWGGLVPVGRREEYMAAAISRKVVTLAAGQAEALRPSSPEPPRDSTIARMTEFKMDVAEPWKVMIRTAQKAAADIADDPNDDNGAERRQLRVRKQNLQLQMQSWLILLDFADYLERNLKPVWTAVKANAPTGLSGYKRDLYDWLRQTLPTAQTNALRNGLREFGSTADALSYEASLFGALRAIVGSGDRTMANRLEDAETLYQGAPAARALWPEFHCLLAGIASDGNGGAVLANGPYALISTLPSKSSPALPDYPAQDDPSGVLTELPEPAPSGAFDINLLDKLTALVARALDRSDESDARPLPFAQTLAASMEETAADAGLFIIRFVHLNEDCGPLHPPSLSEPTERFQLAGFFDPDAPVRPIRITLPADTSPAGLRKHARGTAFVMSNMLCGQVQRAKGLGFIDLVLQVLPWPLHKKIDLGDGGGCRSGGIDIGMICSLSIPIITLCALILLMIIVGLLDFIFRWLPWFVLCFPVPKLMGKKKQGGGT
ncbi:hypothetical protein [Novosphingobium sp. AP12]|uniref:hypothetical protein n=1 Tax=Novosphingobium sp. AP12 TaxID=1144305 RepID=UPI000271E7CB|nr:hypothetical protein [Novosphingobium sp. AP12]EJL23185.1 hypothetical protein PMI02_04266 [Novosphingobium sp. AP12]